MIDQPTNPLVKRPKNDKAPVTVEKLHDLAERLNKTNFALGYGWKYYVGKTTRSGEELACLERRDIAPLEPEQAKVILAEFGLASRYPSNRA